MAILYTAGFDYHGADAADEERYSYANGMAMTLTLPPGGAAGRYGGRAYLQSVNASGSEFLALQGAETAGRCTWWHRDGTDAGVGNNGILIVRNGPSNNAFWIAQATGPYNIELRTSLGTIATSSLSIAGGSAFPGPWYHFDVRWDLGAGTCQVIVDGVTQINASFTPDQSSWDTLVMRAATTGFLAGGDYVVRDDVVVEDGSSPVTLDNHRIWVNLPTGDTSTQWSRNTGTANYEMVDDENPDQLTTYIESTAANDRDVYTFDAPNASGTINAVVVKALCTGGGNIRLGLKEGANEDISANFPVDATLWKEAYYVLEAPPGGGSWTVSEIEACDIVVEADSAGVQVTQITVETLSTTTGPAEPVLTLDAVGEKEVFLSGSEFVEGSGGTHDVSQWEIAHAVDTTFSSPVYNPGDDGTNLTSINITGLQADTDYIARLRYHETPADLYSGWSNTVPFTTTFKEGQKYDPISPGNRLVMAGIFWRENDTDNTECKFIAKFFDSNKNFVSEDFIIWEAADPVYPEGKRKQKTITIPLPILGLGDPAIRFVNMQVEATGDLGERSGADYMCAWINPPAFNLQSHLTIDSSGDVTLNWTTDIDAKVSYAVGNTFGGISGYPVEEAAWDHPDYTPTFTSSTPAQSGSAVIGNIGFGQKMYAIAVAWDNDDKRTSQADAMTITNDEVEGGDTNHCPAGATPDIDWSNGPVHTVCLDQNATPTFSNPVFGQTYTLIIEQDSTGGWTWAWPSTVKVSGGSLPTVTSTANAEDVFELKVAGVGPDVYYLTTVCQDCS